jgi:hypothetical protein
MALYSYDQDVPIGEDVYAKIKQKLGPEPLAGLLVHMVIKRPNGQLRYIDVWESEAQCARAFEERIHPAVFAVFQELGFRPEGEPIKNALDVLEVDTAPAKAT